MSLLSKLLREMFRPKSAEATLRGSSQAINRVYIARDERQTVAFHVAVEKRDESPLRTAVIHPARVEVLAS